MTHKKSSYKKGFTLLETIIALTIFIVAAIAIYGTVQTALSNSIYAKTEVQAFFLGQEVIEYLRNTRDTNILAGSNWLTNFSAQPSDDCYFASPTPKTCIIDTTLSPSDPNAFQVCTSGAGSCPVLRQDSSTSLFGYNSGWNATNFRREVTLQYIGTNEIGVTVNITWSKGLTTRSFIVKELVLNWQ